MPIFVGANGRVVIIIHAFLLANEDPNQNLKEVQPDTERLSYAVKETTATKIKRYQQLKQQSVVIAKLGRM